MPFPDEIIQDTMQVPGPGGAVIGGQAILDLQTRVGAVEDLVVPATKGIRTGRLYGPLESLSGWDAPIAWTPGARFLNASAFQWAVDAPLVGARVPVTTPQPGGTIHMGIYAFDATGAPGELVLDLGLIDCSAAGDRNSVPVNVAGFPRGSYWIGGATNMAGIGFQCVLSGPGVTSTLGHVDTTGTTPRSACYRSAALASGFTSLPSTFGGITTNFAIPAFWLVAG